MFVYVGGGGGGFLALAGLREVFIDYAELY